jgi:hypothetical protein
MAFPFDPGALLGTSFSVDGIRVRLRMARSSDSGLVRALIARAGGDPVELARLVHFDPRRRAVICATALIDGSETLVGIGTIDLDGGEPELVTATAADATELSELLRGALAARAAVASAAARAA